MAEKGVLGKLFGGAGSDPTAGLAASETAQRVADGLNLGNALDNLNPNAMADRMKKGAFAEVIKYEGDNETFIWRHPVQDFNTGSQLIVHENQEAVFFMNGQALDLFGPGRHTLETQNLPLVGRFFKVPTGGVTPFHCEVYFINKVEQLAVKWGTPSKLEYVEPQYGFPIQIGASGDMSLRVSDSRKLLVKVVGTEQGINQQGFIKKMQGFLMVRIKAHLANYIKKEKINIFEIDEHLLRLSEDLHMMFRPDFEDYGVVMERFFVNAIVKPEEDGSYRRFKELHFRQYADVAEAKLRQQTGLIDQQTQKEKMIIEAEGLAHKRAVEGYTYQDERGFDVAERVASNEAVGQMTNMGVGLGMMAGVGSTVGGAVGGMMQNTMGAVIGGAQSQQGVGMAVMPGQQPVQGQQPAPEQQGAGAAVTGQPGMTGQPALICPSCSSQVPAGSRFCLECGQKVQ